MKQRYTFPNYDTIHGELKKVGVTIDEIRTIVEKQGNTRRFNSRDGDMDAFEVALEGSKTYLKHRGLLSDEED